MIAPSPVVTHLAEAIRFPTVARRGEAGEDGAFGALHDYLARTYPRVQAELVRERIGTRSLHYEWRGKNASTSSHVVLMAHLDVVPVLPDTEALWTHPAWSGAIEGGFVYGRGALDDKSALIAILEAVEQLLEDGFEPERTFHLVFGGDEEIGGERGAQEVVTQLRARGIDPAFVLDEGGALVENEVPGIPGLAAVIGIAEKGYFSIELSTEAAGGHSSTPSHPTAIGRLCRAIARLDSAPFPARLGEATRAMLRAIAPAQPFVARVALANPRLAAPLIIRKLLANPKTATLARTTTAPTMFHAGTTENVLPSEARATVNFQILSGDTTASVLEYVKKVIADPCVHVRPAPAGFYSEPSIVSDTSGPAFDALTKSIRETFRATPPLVVPILTGPTDSRFWCLVGARNVYRFTPFKYETDWMARAHGVDERIAVDAMDDGVRFYVQLLRNTDGMST